MKYILVSLALSSSAFMDDIISGAATPAAMPPTITTAVIPMSILPTEVF